MPGYIVVNTIISDPEQYERYRELAAQAVERHGGRYLARGGEMGVLEGDWEPERLVILEFESLEAAQAFYDSQEYRAARDARAGVATMQMVAVAGA